MAKIAKHQASQTIQMEGFEGHYEDVDGYTIGFETYTDDADPAPLFQGLPDDRCQCPHWGVVLKGTLTYRHADGSEDVIGAGEAYYVGPGHLPVMTAGTEIVEFSPTADLTQTIEVVMGNLAALTAAGGAG